MTDPARAPRRAAGFGLRPRVLGWYALLLGLALALTSIVTFQQADQAQRQYVDDELREEIVDFEAAIAAGRADGLRPREAIDSYLDTWPVADRDTLVVRVGSSPARAEGPLGADPALVAAVDAAQGASLSSLDTEQGEARVLATILRVDGDRVGRGPRRAADRRRPGSPRPAPGGRARGDGLRVPARLRHRVDHARPAAATGERDGRDRRGDRDRGRPHPAHPRAREARTRSGPSPPPSTRCSVASRRRSCASSASSGRRPTSCAHRSRSAAGTSRCSGRTPIPRTCARRSRWWSTSWGGWGASSRT